MKSKILQVTLTLKGNNSSGTQSKLIRDGTQNHYKGLWIITKYSQKKGSVTCCCDPKASTLGFGRMSLGTNHSTWLWTCVCHHSARRPRESQLQWLRGCKAVIWTWTNILSREKQRLRGIKIEAHRIKGYMNGIPFPSMWFLEHLPLAFSLVK